MSIQNGSMHLGLEGKHAIVTGASSGIGAGVATALGAAGAHVTLVGRNREQLAFCAKSIRSAGGECLEVVESVTADGGPERIIARATAAYGDVHCLVQNAGAFAAGPLADATAEQFDELFDTNVRAPFLLTRAALPHLPPGSSIVFVGSNLVHHGVPGMAMYSASKGAVEVLARVLAVELGPNQVRVNAVSPGPTRTPMTVSITTNPDLEKTVIAGTPVGRMGEVDDIVSAVGFLLSGAAAGFVSGSTLIVDGGIAAS